MSTKPAETKDSAAAKKDDPKAPASAPKPGSSSGVKPDPKKAPAEAPAKKEPSAPASAPSKKEPSAPATDDKKPAPAEGKDGEKKDATVDKKGDEKKADDAAGEKEFIDPETKKKIEGIVEKLLAAKGNKQQKQVFLKEDEIKTVLTVIRELFMSQQMLLEITPPVRICGDVHGQFYDLLRIFDRCGYPPQSNYLFLGDYVDRGKHSVETIILLYCYKILYPTTVSLLRGNHECAAINKMYGFFDDVKRRYNIRLFKTFTDVFNCMPIAAVVSGKIICMHGGLSPDLDDMAKILAIERPADVPDRGILCDLLWADPEEEVKGFLQSDRGVSYLFGEDIVCDFLDQVDMDLIVRAHQVMEKGYGFFAQRQLVTLFSAPNYCGEFDNDAAVMNIDERLQCSFVIIHAKV